MDTFEQAMPFDLDLSCSLTVFIEEARISLIYLFVVLLILSWKHHLCHLLDRMWLLMDLYSDQSNLISPAFLKRLCVSLELLFGSVKA